MCCGVLCCVLWCVVFLLCCVMLCFVVLCYVAFSFVSAVHIVRPAVSLLPYTLTHSLNEVCLSACLSVGLSDCLSVGPNDTYLSPTVTSRQVASHIREVSFYFNASNYIMTGEVIRFHSIVQYELVVSLSLAINDRLCCVWTD